MRALMDPARLADLRVGDWSALIPWLRRSGLLGEVAVLIADASLRVPEVVADQLLAARRLIDRQQVIIGNEISLLEPVLAPRLSKLVLLKGSAYQALGLPNARARFASDVDLMVTRPELGLAERLLQEAGWERVNRSSYDEHYYRDWMHEVPPMRHAERGTFVDLHHAITPPVSRLAIPTQPLMANARQIPGSALFALSPADMVLHCACHVLSDGDFSLALRDFLDLQSLMVHFGRFEPEFWRDLRERASEFGVRRTLYHAVALLNENQFVINIPDHALSDILSWGPPGPLRRPVQAIMGRAILPTLRPGLPEHLANRLMVARSHYLRMPLRLLVPHLLRKSLLRVRRSLSTASTAAPDGQMGG